MVINILKTLLKCTVYEYDDVELYKFYNKKVSYYQISPIVWLVNDHKSESGDMIAEFVKSMDPQPVFNFNSLNQHWCRNYNLIHCLFYTLFIYQRNLNHRNWLEFIPRTTLALLKIL